MDRTTFTPSMDPNTYAYQYAQSNNVSVDEAKAALKAKYGDPTQEAGMSMGASIFTQGEPEDAFVEFKMPEDKEAGAGQFSLTDLLQTLYAHFRGNSTENGEGPQNEGDPEFHLNGSNGLPPEGTDPDKYAEQYAEENGLTLEEAKAELSAKYGDPTEPTGSRLSYAA